MDSTTLASYIDHTLLKPEASPDQVKKLCQEARQHKFATVCVNPWMTALAAGELAGSGVGVAVVVGFPLGATTTIAKVMETRDAVANGASELDMVLNVGALKAGDLDYVRSDIAAVVTAGGASGVKVIFENCLLTDAEIVTACKLCLDAGAAFVKTSTGFSTGGATVENVKLMRDTVGSACGVKAAGGIRDKEAASAMIAAGASRIGTSAGVAIVTGA